MPRKRRLSDRSVPRRLASDDQNFDGALASADVAFTNADAPAAATLAGTLTGAGREQRGRE